MGWDGAGRDRRLPVPCRLFLSRQSQPALSCLVPSMFVPSLPASGDQVRTTEPRLRDIIKMTKQLNMMIIMCLVKRMAWSFCASYWIPNCMSQESSVIIGSNISCLYQCRLHNDPKHVHHTHPRPRNPHRYFETLQPCAQDGLQKALIVPSNRIR